jgi:2-keto-4-pentenoate hydratase/2-oxohepta-3-ene-1,7-dioic acid hydratase in catechol pathway
MRLVSYRSDSGPRVAGFAGGGYVDLNTADPQLPSDIIELFALGPAGIQRAKQAVALGTSFGSENVRLLAPIPRPGKVICVGLNYADHAAESGAPIPEEPVIFNKFPSSVCGHEDAIVLPHISTQVDYEAELVVVIGRGGRHLSESNALQHVAGYCCGHDVSARDWQLGKPGKQWLLGKTFDTFAPFGPHLVTADEVGDPGNLGIQLRLNAQTMQSSSTRQLIFSIPKLVAYISGVCTLAPGDVIFTGTPPGVGPVKPGDELLAGIDGVGELKVKITAAL